MKKLLITIIIISYSTLLFSQSFYRYKGKKIDLRVDSTTFVIQSNNHLIEKQNKVLEEQLQKKEIDRFKMISGNRFLVVGARHQFKDYDYLSNIYRNHRNRMVIILPRIVIMFKQETNLSSVLNKYAGKLVKESGDSQKYILKCNVSQSEEVLRLVNELDSRDDVVWCEPEFLSEYKIENTLYSQQYYLNNTGQDGGIAGIDINVEPAWSITNGNSDITVAVVDAGVDRTHEDMSPRVLEGFTIRNATGEGEPQNANSLDTKYHGVACAGIVAASNNTLGIRGVASNVNILPVNIVPDAAFTDWLGRTVQGFGSNIEIAEAINWAWHRADVLSCSWGGDDPSNDIALAIDSARVYGRDGRGSVVVFSSGNYYPDFTDVLFPGRVDGVITVGAITNRGVICNYSQRGVSMDLVAPTGDVNSDGNVRTTDRMGSLGDNSGNYMEDFGGTSAACPQVAGVAALMLSANPFLTETEVRTTLQQTATDMGSSGFDNTYGYGRVNAYAAVQAVNLYTSGPSYVCTNTEVTFTVNNAPTSYTWNHSNNLAPVVGNPGTFTTLFLKGDAWVSISVNGIEAARKEFVIGSEVTGIDQISYAGKNRYYASPACAGELNNMWILEWQGMDLLVDKPDTVYGRNYVDVISTTNPNNLTIATLTLKQGGYTYTKFITLRGVDVGLDGIHIPTPFDPVLTFSPNPTVGETTISIEQGSANETSLKSASSETTFDENAEWDLEVYNSMQSLKLKKQKLKGSSVTINTQSWKEGVYMVRVKYKGEILTGKLVVKK